MKKKSANLKLIYFVSLLDCCMTIFVAFSTKVSDDRFVSLPVLTEFLKQIVFIIPRYSNKRMHHPYFLYNISADIFFGLHTILKLFFLL